MNSRSISRKRRNFNGYNSRNKSRCPGCLAWVDSDSRIPLTSDPLPGGLQVKVLLCPKCRHTKSPRKRLAIQESIFNLMGSPEEIAARALAAGGACVLLSGDRTMPLNPKAVRP